MPGTPKTRRCTRPFGDIYLATFGTAYVLTGLFLAFNPGGSTDGVAYHVLLAAPRALWALMWLICGAAMLRALYTRRPHHRALASAFGVNAALVWTLGIGAALVIEPRSGAAMGPLLMACIALLHYAVAACFRSDDTRVWGRTRP